MMRRWRNLFSKDRQERPDPKSETFLIDQAIERAQKDRIETYNRYPQLLVDEVQKIAEEHPGILKDYGGAYFMSFAAGVLVERFGIAVETANQAASGWNYRLITEAWDKDRKKIPDQEG